MAQVVVKPPTKEEMLERYATRLSSTGDVRKHLLSFAKEFIDYSEGKWDRQTLDKYFAHIKKKHDYGDSSMNFSFRVIRTVFNRNGLDWPYNRGEAPMIRESEINAPALNPITVKRMIEAVKASKNRTAQALLAISTTYGLRRQEMMNLTEDNIDYDSKTLFVATLKHGRERTHLLPDEIAFYTSMYDFDIERSENSMINMWYQIEDMIGLHHLDHVGWHSVRRTLDTVLLHSFPETTVSSFLRWKQATSSNMAFRYSKTKFVGEAEDVTELSSESMGVDQLIFGKDENGNYKHPFLGSWV
jgi:integrase